MTNVNALLTQRLKKGDNSSKMAAMARQSASGNLTSFSGVFSVNELSENEKMFLREILDEHALGKENVEADWQSLISITSEVKAINNQAAILHGERIKKAQKLLTPYRDGAFTRWLLAAYGNRQTPYNFLQYYEFYEAMPRSLRPQLEVMPRQAVYTLASREGELDKKRKIVENYNGENKIELLLIIREAFPLDNEDKRKANPGEAVIAALEKARQLISRKGVNLTKSQRNAINGLMDSIREALN